MSVFSGKNIVVCVTGSIAAFKVAGWVSDLAKEEALVHVVMTRAAEKFITPLTFSALSGNRVHTDMFAGAGEAPMAHIDLGREADLMVVAPASANTIAKLGCGISDNLLTTTALATRAPVLVFPAMNSKMYAHRATVGNLTRLRDLGYFVINPDSGLMACKEEGQGRLVEWDAAKEHIATLLSRQDFAGKKILVTAGPTREPIDPARFISNRSSGKMGYALARCARRRGAEVVLVSGPTALEPPLGVQCIKVQSGDEMYKAVMSHSEKCDVIIKSAAVADYRPAEYFEQKVKKDRIDLNLKLAQNRDILLDLGARKKAGQILVGFAAESEKLREAGRKKLQAKKLDLIAVNDISSENSGFEVDTNRILLLTESGEHQLPLTSKHATSDLILDHVARLQNTVK